MLAVAASVGLNAAMFATGAVTLVPSLLLILVRGMDNRAPAMHAAGAVDGKQGLTSVLTPTIIFLTGFFALLSLSGSGISNFSVVALGTAFGTPLAAASLVLTVYLSMQAMRLKGHPGRAKALIRFIQYMRGHPQVWVCRREDIARHWMARFPAPA